MTNKTPYTSPGWEITAFNCVHCGAFAAQIWRDLHFYSGSTRYPEVEGGKICFCGHCQKFSIWLNGKMVYPDFSGIEPLNPDLDTDVQADYLEAAEIVQKSPRGAAALLRLAIQKLCIQLGEDNNLNKAIASLVKKGLPTRVQQSLDALRVIGNEAIHPGELDLRDDAETATSLFRLVNFIAEKMITEPREIETIYEKIPETKKKQIENRDNGHGQ